MVSYVYAQLQRGKNIVTLPMEYPVLVDSSFRFSTNVGGGCQKGKCIGALRTLLTPPLFLWHSTLLLWEPIHAQVTVVWPVCPILPLSLPPTLLSPSLSPCLF